ncbi:hypothetical protein Cylst_5959 [Cylindrospermum stagnale PCC 7417]|uniref:Uncharacterized protein n=1 Tax=Cylindrospermum stagnale PCC 7417 TaxID=56107 RepID=K9X754_9NOST|nr:hypothetical protein [Cylindrospermum stagnale]AFZ27934.1 hypothetical protein Cylst_5959 [Cylindrospermum stagnale PCC 7417]
MLTTEQQQQWLIFWLFVWVVVVILVCRSLWNKKLPSTGLPLIYLLNLSILHFIGGLIYALPWYKPQSAYLLNSDFSLTNTYLGFNQTVYGVIGFGLGSTILAPWLLKVLKPSCLSEFHRQPNLKLAKTYIELGLFFTFVLYPILAKIPSFSALSTSGISLFIVGLCLAFWKAWYMSDKQAFRLWLAITCSLPLFTVLILGFIGFGAAAALVVLIFVFNFYRPRWKVIVIALLALVFGLSVFVTYFRDRNEIRAKVWGGQSASSRLEQFWQTASTFELINLSKQEHLEVIDIRLNQNVLVGQAVSYITSSKVDYAGGATLVQAAISVVPRLLWPDKPVVGGSGDLVSIYTGIKFADGTSVGVGSVLEFYINFGSWGVVLGFVVLGTVIRIIDIVAGKKLIYGNWVGFTSWFLPGLGMIQPGGSLSEVVATTSASIVLVSIINQVYIKKASRGERISPQPFTYYD